jgi:hypothetical protein
MLVEHATVSVPAQAPSAAARPRADGGYRAAPSRALPLARWRFFPWTAPRVCLGAAIVPDTRLEVALCELLRCRREWRLTELALRLSLAPLGSDGAAYAHVTPGSGSVPRVGAANAWRTVERWLACGVLVPTE